jgi:hypothetical protein
MTICPTPNNPPLTTIRQPTSRMGALAVDTLIDIIQNPGAHKRHIVLPVELVIRESCGTLRVSSKGGGSSRNTISLLQGYFRRLGRYLSYTPKEKEKSCVRSLYSVFARSNEHAACRLRWLPRNPCQKIPNSRLKLLKKLLSQKPLLQKKSKFAGLSAWALVPMNPPLLPNRQLWTNSTPRRIDRTGARNRR